MKRPLVILVPFFQAQPKHMKKYQDLWLQLGFESQVVWVPDHMGSIRQSFWEFWGLWILKALNQLKPQTFWVHAFSNRAASALWALHQVTGLTRCQGIIFDSGPSFFLGASFWGLLRYGKKWPRLGALLASAGAQRVWGQKWTQMIQEVCGQSRWPALFLASQQDRIIPYWCQQWVYQVYAGPKRWEGWESGEHVGLWVRDPVRYRRSLETFVTHMSP